MHTQKRFTELTLKRFDTRAKEITDISADFAAVSAASKARIQALSEVLGISQQSILDELLDSALGDAHDGFLAAFADAEERDRANQKLKARVKELL